MLRDSFFKKRSVQKRKNGAASPVPSIWPGISSPHEKGEPRKGRPIGHKKGIQKDASVLGLIAFEVLRLSKGHLAGNTIFPESALCCGALNMRSASRPFKMGKA